MIRRALLALAVATGLAAPATAQEQCRLALLLGLDVSASVDAGEYAQQIEGLAAALIDPNVVEAALSGNGPVALSIYEWSGRFQQDILVDWTLIRSEEDLTTVAERVLRATRRTEDFPTALGYALGFAASHFADAPPCLFQTLDISGDGQNNDGFPPDAAYAHFPLAGVTVNGLAIGGASREIEQYYRDEVIQGPGAFVEFARSHDDFAEAMRRKLERELRVVILGQLDAD
ncbi:DUF1194 domain-containing protein [Maritalea mobilis]|uniref:DUF1194 domain-containing protein n=1 Tax=Maritalea mobilis TaxID=483324 RepID=UPI0027E0F2AA|nr:DUF1194 domain-containing protein [Maritalea mobilis]